MLLAAVDEQTVVPVLSQQLVALVRFSGVLRGLEQCEGAGKCCWRR